MSANDLQVHFEKLEEFGVAITPTEEFVNNCGYTQLRTGNLDDAIDIFKQNVKDFRDSFNAFDSMGEAYMIKGKRELAISSYKSILLNPNKDNGKEILKKLKAEIKVYPNGK